MITYVDTSALIKLLIAEDGSESARVVWGQADRLATVVLTSVEVRAGLSAAERGGRMTAAQHLVAKQELDDLIAEVVTCEITDDLVRAAGDLAEAEGLRGYDAVHLAGALVAGAQVLASADRALCDAAERHGLVVANPLDAPEVS